MNGVEDMIYMSSKSANDGSYRLTVTFKVGTDRDMALVRVQNRVKLAEPSLPVEVRAMGLNIDERSPDILKIISFYSPDRSLDYKFISNYVKINVQSCAGATRRHLLGRYSSARPPTRCGSGWIRTRWPPCRCRCMDVRSAALTEQNVQVAAGKIGAPPFDGELQTEYTLQTKGRLQDVEEFENIVLRARADGSAVYLRDIARVELGQSDYNFFGEVGGTPRGECLPVYLLARRQRAGVRVPRRMQTGRGAVAIISPRGMDYVASATTPPVTCPPPSIRW